MKSSKVIPLDQSNNPGNNDSDQLSTLQGIYEKENPKPFRNYRFQMKRMFGDLQLEDKDILDVGCGHGFLSLYLACIHGSSRITALDEAEGDGSCTDVLNVLEQNVQTIGLDNVSIVKADFNTWKPENTFDVIVAKNAIHHFPWEETITKDTNAFIFKNPKIHDNFITVFTRIRSLLKPGGYLVFGDVSRANVYRLLPHYIAKKFRTVNWKTKPSKKEWLYLMESTGFENVGYVCDVPYKLRSLARIWKPFGVYLAFPDFYFSGRNPNDIDKTSSGSSQQRT